MAGKPSTVAVIALCTSLGSALFSGYQWWNGQREARIVSAIEISRKYAERPDNDPLLEAASALFENEQLNAAQKMLIYKNMHESEYVAYLINRDKVDFDYLSTTVKCGIYGSYMLSEKLGSRAIYVAKFSEIATFGRRVAAQCSPYFRMELGELPQSN